MQAKDILAEHQQKISLTEFEHEFYPSSPRDPRYHKIARLANIAAVKAGWLLKGNGIWHLTDEGQKAYEQFGDPEVLYKEADRLYREWKSRRSDVDITDEDLGGEEDEVRVTFEQVKEDAWQEIHNYLGSMPWLDFQDLVANLLTAMGYHVAWVAPPGRDFGVDIVSYTDLLGATNPRIKVQVKRWVDSSTNVEGLRTFMSVLSDDDVGVFVSAGGFTRDAQDEARMQERRKITLIDLQKFDLRVEHYGHLSEDARRRLPHKPKNFLAPEDWGGYDHSFSSED